MFLLAACGEQTVDSQTLAADAGRIECAGPGESAFRRDCTIARSRGADGALVLTVSDPAGGFRRLRVVDDGRGVAAADGAEEARVSLIEGGGIEVALGRDRYRLPATIGAR